MPRTAAEEAEYQDYIAQYDRPSLLGRFGEGMANLTSTAPETMTNLFGGLFNMISEEPLPKVEYTKPYDIPAPQNWKEQVVDAGPAIADFALTSLVPETLIARGAKAISMAPRMANILGGFGSNAALTSSYTDDREQQLAQGAIGGVLGAARGLPYLNRILPAVIGGAGAGMEAYSAGASPAAAIAQGAVAGASTLLGKPEAQMRGPAVGGPIIPDEIIPPSGRWNRAKPIRDDILVQELDQLKLRDKGESIPGRPELPDKGPITPVYGPNGDNLPIDRQLYNVQLEDHASRVPFTMRDGTIVPTFEARKLLPDHVVGQVEPTAAEAAIATLQTPAKVKPHILDIEPTINIHGTEYRGSGTDYHQHILDRYMNHPDHVDDFDAIANFDDSRRNPNYFTDSQGNKISRKELKEMYNVADAQGLRRLQAKERATNPPPPPSEPTPIRTPWGPTEQPARFQPKAPEPAPVVPPSVLPKDMTPTERRVARMQRGKEEAAQRRIAIAKQNGSSESPVIATVQTPKKVEGDIKIWRGVKGEHDPRTGREGYIITGSTNKHVAQSYIQEHETPHPLTIKGAKVIEFPVTKSKTSPGNEHSKVEFDNAAQRLKKGEVLVARNVYDPGPWGEPSGQHLHTYPSDIYATRDPSLLHHGHEEIPTPVKKSSAKPLDVEKFTEGNSLRVVPEEKRAGVTVFETVRDVGPKAGKLRFELPEGISHAEANRMFKTKRAEALATLQGEGKPKLVPDKPTIPFQDVPSADVTDQELRRMGLEVGAYGSEVIKPAPGLKKLTGDGGATYMEILAKGLQYGVAPLVGGAINSVMDKENHMRAFVYGAIASGILAHYGVKGIQKLLAVKPGNFKLILKGAKGQLAEQATNRGRGDIVARTARFLEQNFENSVPVQRALSKAEGRANEVSQAFSIAIKHLQHAWPGLSTAQIDALTAASGADPITYPIALRNLMAQVSNEVVSAMVLERVTRQQATSLAVEGLPTNSLMRQHMENTLGTYFTRVFKIHFDPEFLPKEADIEDAIQELRLMTSTGTGMLGPMMEYDISRAIVHRYLHDTYVDRGLEGVASQYGHSSKAAESLQDALRKRIPELEKRPAFRKMMGEVTDPLQVRAATAMKLTAAVRSGQFFNDMMTATTERGNKFVYQPDEWVATMHNLRGQIASPTPPPNIATLQLRLQELEHYIPAGDHAHLGKIANTYIHRQVGDRLPGYDGIFYGNHGPLIRQMVAVSNFYKTTKVGANPKSWFRTTLGIPFFCAVAGVNPVDYYNAVKILKKGGITKQEMMQQGILSGGYGTGEMRKDLNMTMNPNLDKPGVMNLWNRWVHTGAQIFDFADSSVRAAKYLKVKNELYKQGVLIPANATGHTVGLTEQQIRDYATDQTNRYTPNYATLPRGIRIARQMPFINQFLSYFAETARITKNLWMDVKENKNGNRWKALAALVAIPSMFAGAQYVSESLLNEDEKKEWDMIKRLLPAYKRHGFLVPVRKNSDGSFRYYNISPLFIADDLAKMTKAILSGDMKGLLDVNPIFGWDNTPAITSGIALLGYDLREGRKIVLKEDRLDMVRKDMLPPLLGGYEMDNFVNAMTRDADGNLGVTNMKTGQRFKLSDLIASYPLGVSGQDVKSTILAQRAQMDAEEQIKALEGKMNQFLLTNPTEEKKALAEQIMYGRIKEIVFDLQDKINGPEIGKAMRKAFEEKELEQRK